MKRFWQILLGLVVLGATMSAQAMSLGLRMTLWNRSARMEQSYPVGEAVGADAQSASLPWEVGTNGVAAAKGYDDATAAGGKSVKFTAADEASAYVETVVTNACRVSFDWKCSCEPLVKGRPYDYLAFAVDGEQQGFICGETVWTSVTNYVTGEGEHLLRWMFQRDEDGSSGEDCSWLANVKVTPSVTLTFAGGGATEGTAPEPITAYANESIILPGQGSLAWPRHHFIGWTNGESVYQAGAECLVSEIADVLVAVWEEDEPQTFGEYLNWPEQTFTTGGNAEWTRVKGVSVDGYALRSGAITHSQTSRLETVVSGPGTVTFSCKVAGEIVKKTVYDGLAFCIDGVQQGELMGNAQWTNNTFEVVGAGTHTLGWFYVKDDGDMVDVGEDCAWGDGVTWIPAGVTVDMGDGKSVTVPGAWIAEHSALVVAASGNAEAALQATAANGRMSVAQCYVVGLDPESTTNDFRITSFPMKADGTPDLENIVFDPPVARWNVPGAWPMVKGAARLDGEWQAVTEENKASFRFFKVEVVLP